jgi:hypothetical protein
MTTPTPEPTIAPVSYRIDHLGFNVNAVLVEDGLWALQGPAMDLVSQLSLHGGPQAQAYRWPTHEAAEAAAVALLAGGARFVQTIGSLDPARA